MTTAITEFCKANEHVLLGAFQGSRGEERLARESHQLLHDIEPILGDFLQLMPAPKTLALQDAVPKLVLHFAKNDYRQQQPREVLQAFMKLVHHSVRLNAWPRVKTAFWSMMANTMLLEKRNLIVTRSIPQPTFPQFMIWYGHPRTGAWSTVDQELGDTICGVLTESREDLIDVLTEKPSVEISFAYERKMVDRTREQLELIEQMLDRVFQSSSLQCNISSLDFSYTIMDAPLMKIAARIVEKCRSGRYRVEQVKLDSVTPDGDDLPPALLQLMSRAFLVDTLPPVVPQPVPAIVRGDQSVLTKISLSGNDLTPDIFAEHFSALRYGCVLQEDLTKYAINSGFLHKQNIHLDSWRWLAFALFYPRPKRFASAFKLHSLGRLVVTPPAIRMIVNTVRNPVAQLVNNDLDGDDTSVAKYLMVCTVKAGANIEVFVSGMNKELIIAGDSETRPIVPHVKTVVETSEFEALCERPDGSVCVVVPGAGLGWVVKNDVVLLEREPLDLALSAHDGRYDISICGGATGVPTDRIALLFESIGRQFKSLTFDFDYHERLTSAFTHDFINCRDESVIQAIFSHCVHLKHLSVIDASTYEMSHLLDALDGSYIGGKLLTLNLNDNRCIGNDEFMRLASIVGRTTNPLALQELRVKHYSQSASTMSRLHDALVANRSLALIELYSAKSYRPQSGPRPEARLEEEARLDAAFHDQVLSNAAGSAASQTTRRVVVWSDECDYSPVETPDSPSLALGAAVLVADECMSTACCCCFLWWWWR